MENLGGFTILHLQYNILAFSKTVEDYIELESYQKKINSEAMSNYPVMHFKSN